VKLLSAATRRLLGARALTAISSAVLVVALASGAIWLASSPGSYSLHAVFSNGQGLFPGAAVRLLGVRIGTVTSVDYEGGSVHVSMQIDGDQQLPAGVRAALVSPLLLGQPDVELDPGYTGGPTMPGGATIPESRTAVPVSTDMLLKQLQRVLGAVPPSSMHGLVANLATDLAGQGSQLGQLISSASGTLALLAEKGDELGRLDGSLAQLTGTLRGNESQLLDLVSEYQTVAGVIAAHQQALGSAIADLSRASAQLAGLLSPNLKPLHDDVAVIATAGRTLDRNLSNLDGIMSSSRSLFAVAHRAYSPQYRWLNLNNQLAPGLSASVMEGLIRDRLAGICRRVLAHHAAGLPPKAKATLAKCGNPDSGYFDPILGLVPEIIAKGDLPGAGAPAVSDATSPAASLLAPGLASIPGLTPAQRQRITSALSPSAPRRHRRRCPALAGSAAGGSSVDRAIDCLLGPLPPLGGAITSTTIGTSGGLVGAAPQLWWTPLARIGWWR